MIEKNYKDYSEIIAKEARNLGVKENGIVLMHSSLSSFGLVPGGAETVINGILLALGNMGTLLVPALSYQYVNERNRVFDVRNTPSNIGVIPEYFRNRKDVLRSLNPTHSVCGCGEKAKDILNKHYIDETPCGENSPYHLLSKLGGQLLFIGCGLRPNTSMHGIEETIEPDYLFKGFVEYDVIDYNGQKSCRKCKRHNFKGFVQRYDRVQNILEKGEIKNGKILKAESYIIQAENLWKKAKKALSKDPHYFVDRLF